MRQTAARTVLVVGLVALSWGGVSWGQSPFIRGDANQSFEVDVSDALAVLEHLFRDGAATLRCRDAGDVNDDGRLNIIDPVLLLDFLFRGANAPPQPYPACGKDPTSDSLRCTAFRTCQSGGYRVSWMAGGSSPSDLSNSGHVAVTVDDRAARWSPMTGESLLLGTLPDADPRSFAFAVNDQGNVVGTVYSGDNHLARAYLWTEERGMEELPSLGGPQIAPTDINNQDQVVGWAHRDGVWRFPFLWTREEGTRLLHDLKGGASALNEQGWVVGYIEEGRSSRPFLWKPNGETTELGVVAGFDVGGAAVDLNERGDVLVSFLKTGPSNNGSTPVYAAPFLWNEEAGLLPLPAPEGYNDVRAQAINNDGVILIDARNRRPREQRRTGCLIQDGELKALPVYAGETRYSDLTDEGWLLGDTGSQQGIVAQPVP